jgi:DNA-binding transcriptional LysR family regulator
MTRKLGEHTFVVVHHKRHPLANKRMTLARYAKSSHLLVAPQGSGSSRVDELLEARGLQRHIALTTRHFSTAPFIVASSDVLWTAPHEIAVIASRYVELVLRTPPLRLEPFGYYLSWHERAQADPAHRWLRQLILDARAAQR